MRKWLWIGTASVVLGGLGVWGYLESTKYRLDDVVVESRSSESTRPTGRSGSDDSEACDVIEPLVVECATPAQRQHLAQQRESLHQVAQLARVELAAGVRQQPRPDAEPGKGLRMPYADEDELVPALLRLLQADLGRLNIFGEPEQPDPAEESETRTETPMPLVPDYHHHHQHCPYTGGYYRR